MPRSDPPDRPPAWFRIAARLRGALTYVSVFALLGGAVAVVAGRDGPVGEVGRAVFYAGIGALAVVMAATLLPGAPAVRPRTLAAPVRGRWRTVNSPANRRPSHGTHGLGQTHAVDLVFDPADRTPPRFGWTGGFVPPSARPGFGQPVYAPAEGTVVAVRDGQRDHRCRASWPGLVYLLVEGVVRELLGPRFLLGNHIVLDVGGGEYVVLAHLRRRSLTVRPGARVAAGAVLGGCGNSGNSSEPHLHLQLMDHAHPQVAAGLPFRLADVIGDHGRPLAGLPPTGEHLRTTRPPAPTMPTRARPVPDAVR
ncbi:hypothetical protein GCM10010123_25430 [Pilimelia anulata]|uniref:M23ase beta-sheet core domain-containing protein n=1 Tax=Pilimelia anulata TaxID=53371 RepID=A0A8J3B472_9ACTN|nr:M23 family metallopeptidase [Pilimelia anulata]GGJ94478.1 hypothetical protein GCM10010123_25430 [Pilimelia anulata]